ncbi:MAG: MlaD family protein [Saprospiraceae bacterium]
MQKRGINNIKLGAFVLSGLGFLVLLLFMIGKNRSLFGSTYTLKARFENVQGLVAGNNIRFSGIESGTVKSINILNDTTIEVTMNIEKKMQAIIRKNAFASIGTEGLVGNKVVNITPSHTAGDLAIEGDLLITKQAMSPDEMLQNLNKTNEDIEFITKELMSTIQRINNSSALWSLLNDPSLPTDVKISLGNIRSATGKAALAAEDFYTLITDVKNGQGSVGRILKDTSYAQNLNDAILKIKEAGDEADAVAKELNNVVSGIQKDINSGNGAIHSMLRDSMVTKNINESLENIRQGTDRFNQNMEALKHNFLFRGYFKKLEKENKKKN